VTAKQVTAEDREKLGQRVTIVEKAGLEPDRFAADVRRAMSGRQQIS
jgi:hypothetical protein